MASDGRAPDLRPSQTLAEGALREGGTFWRDVFTFHHNVAPVILPRVAIFGAYAFAVSLVHRYVGWAAAETSPVEFMGAFLALMLVLRTNAGYDRWWESRKLWGSVVNQSRNLVTMGLSYGPRDPAWRDLFVRRVAAFAHVARRSLRGERDLPEVARLLGEEEAARIAAAPHMPSMVAHDLARMLRSALDAGGIGAAEFRQTETQRGLLVDHVGNCERILRTRFPGVHRTMLGQLIVVYLIALPFLIVREGLWVEAAVTLAVAYPLFALDQIARELGNPFSTRNRSHLPLDEICAGIEEGVLALLADHHRVEEEERGRATSAAPGSTDTPPAG